METDVIHRTGFAQAEDQLLREGQQWQGFRRRMISRHTVGSVL